jgi:hypothetical protein
VSHAKPVDERAGGQQHVEVITAADAARLVAPPVPEHLSLSDDLRDRWAALWTSPVATVLDPVSDIEPVARLFELYELDRAIGRATRKHIDSLRQLGDWIEEGTPAFDPQLVRTRMSVAAEIRQLEQTLGVSPRGRLTIGLAVLAAGKAAAGANEEGEHDDADD